MARRLAVLLMVIAVGGCDNVEWGGLEIAVLPPPPRSGPAQADLEAGERLPESPILYYVTRDSTAATVIPVAEVTDAGMLPILPGNDPEEFGDRFIAAFMRAGAEYTLYRQGRRAGTLVVDSAVVPAGAVCHPLPRATGRMELSGNAAGATEFLAMARTQAPPGITLPGDSLRVEGRMQVVGNILAERILRNRGAQLPNWQRARVQILPFPLSEARDAGFTATFLTDDELRVGNDDIGYSLYVVYTPQAQTGYDTAYVAYTSYTAEGKAARRTIDFLDWNRDGSPELLVEVYGTQNSWFEAIGADDDGWERLFEHRCESPGAITTGGLDPAPAAPPASDTARAVSRSSQQQPVPRPSSDQPASQPAAPPAATPERPPADTTPVVDGEELPDLEPRVNLAVPRTPARRPPPDTGGARP